MTLTPGIISSQDWGLPVVTDLDERPHPLLGISLAELETKARAATYEWLLRQFDEATGAFYGHYRAPDRYHEPPQTVNLIAPWQLLAAYDRYQDEALLATARRAAEWFYRQHVVSHPMSIVAGGARDGGNPDHVWTKFSAEEAITCLGFAKRLQADPWLARAEQSGRYLIQARRHDYAPRHALSTGQWLTGWDSWGRVVTALLLLWQTTGAQHWLDEAVQWGEYAQRIQADNGGFYLIDGEYYNTDLAADEVRALVWLGEITGRPAFTAAARRFADWHLDRQTAAGAWPLTIDRDDNVVMPTIGPGDVPNIGIALLYLYHITHAAPYLEAALRTIRYALSVQITPGSDHPYTDDEHVRWGFWSWDPRYDDTLSGDQSTHHARGMWFLIDYLTAYPAGTQQA